MTQRVILATHNQHKVTELRRILGPLLTGIELSGYDGPEPRETGTSFRENALIKARAAAEHTGLPALADDSGIRVAVLGGAPGIFSARWAGPAKDSRQNYELLLWQLADIAPEHRAAEFVAAAALVLPGVAGEEGAEELETVEIVEEGIWPGRILSEARGENGFGYDPIFQPQGHDRSSAELSAEEKDRESHRTRAFLQIIPELRFRLGLDC